MFATHQTTHDRAHARRRTRGFGGAAPEVGPPPSVEPADAGSAPYVRPTAPALAFESASPRSAFAPGRGATAVDALTVDAFALDGAENTDPLPSLARSRDESRLMRERSGRRSRQARIARRVATGLAIATLGALGVQQVGALVASPPPAPIVQLTPAQAALADTLPAHPGVLPVLDAGRVADDSTASEPAMTPRAFALIVATLARAGYTFTSPDAVGAGHAVIAEPTEPVEPVEPAQSAGQAGHARAEAATSSRSVILVVDADPATITAVDPILERFDAHAVAVARPDQSGRPTAPPTGTPATDAASRHRWSIAPSLPTSGEHGLQTLPLPADTTPESLTHLLRTVVPAPVRLDSPTYLSHGADCVTGSRDLHVAALSGRADGVDMADSICRPALNADAWQDYRLITDITPMKGTALVTLRDNSASRGGRIEVRVQNQQLTVVETGATPAQDHALGSLPLPPVTGATRRVEAGIEGEQLTIAVDGMPVRTSPVGTAANPSGGVGFGAVGDAAEATFEVLGIAGR